MYDRDMKLRQNNPKKDAFMDLNMISRIYGSCKKTCIQDIKHTLSKRMKCNMSSKMDRLSARTDMPLIDNKPSFTESCPKLTVGFQLDVNDTIWLVKLRKQKSIDFIWSKTTLNEYGNYTNFL